MLQIIDYCSMGYTLSMKTFQVINSLELTNFFHNYNKSGKIRALEILDDGE